MNLCIRRVMQRYQRAFKCYGPFWLHFALLFLVLMTNNQAESIQVYLPNSLEGIASSSLYSKSYKLQFPSRIPEMVIEVRNLQQGLKEITNEYHAASGISGISAYFKNDKPFFFIRLWVWTSTWVILPQVTLAHLYTALFTRIPLATRFLSLSLGLDQLQTTIKCHYMLHNLKRFRSIMLDLETFNCVNHLGSQATATMLKMCKLVKWLRSTYNFACYFTFIAWTIVPVVSTPRALFYGKEGESMMKVLPPEYPFATDYFPMIQFIYGLESLSTFVILTYFASTNLIMVTDILLICQLFLVLNDSVAPAEGKKAMSLRKFAVDHQKLLKICAEVRDLLSPLLAIQLGVSVMTITLAVFEITMVNQAPSDDSLNQIVLMSRKTSYTFIIFVELLLYCWLSTELELSCLSVRNGVYNSEWYNKLGTKDYRNLIMISMRALKPVKLNAMNIVTLSLGTSLEVKIFYCINTGTPTPITVNVNSHHINVLNNWSCAWQQVLRMAYSYYTYLKRLR